jgi:hypothetical protein
VKAYLLQDLGMERQSARQSTPNNCPPLSWSADRRPMDRRNPANHLLTTSLAAFVTRWYSPASRALHPDSSVYLPGRPESARRVQSRVSIPLHRLPYFVITSPCQRPGWVAFGDFDARWTNVADAPMHSCDIRHSCAKDRIDSLAATRAAMIGRSDSGRASLLIAMSSRQPPRGAGCEDARRYRYWQKWGRDALQNQFLHHDK